MTPHGSGRPWWRNLTDGIRTRLWPVPAAAIMLSIAVGVALPVYDAGLLQRLPSGLAAYLFSGGPEAARSVLQTVAGSLITVTSLTFSLTIVTLQLASGQYSPRLLRTFTRDRVVHATLAMLLATFTYALTVLRTVRTQDDAAGAFVPRLSVTTAYLLALFSVMTVAGFLAHLARKIRVESMLRDVHAEAARTLRQNLSPRDRSVEASDTPTPPDAAVMVLCAHASGFVTSVDEKELLTAALDSDAVIQVGRSPGESIVAGTPVARAWPVDGRQPTDEHRRPALQRSVTGAVRLGFERTSAHDVAFGLRQLTDVAIKALSPAVNDPTTAVHALGHSAALLCEAAPPYPRPPGPPAHERSPSRRAVSRAWNAHGRRCPRPTTPWTRCAIWTPAGYRNSSIGCRTPSRTSTGWPTSAGAKCRKATERATRKPLARHASAGAHPGTPLGEVTRVRVWA